MLGATNEEAEAFTLWDDLLNGNLDAGERSLVERYLSQCTAKGEMALKRAQQRAAVKEGEKRERARQREIGMKEKEEQRRRRQSQQPQSHDDGSAGGGAVLAGSPPHGSDSVDLLGASSSVVGSPVASPSSPLMLSRYMSLSEVKVSSRHRATGGGGVPLSPLHQPHSGGGSSSWASGGGEGGRDRAASAMSSIHTVGADEHHHHVTVADLLGGADAVEGGEDELNRTATIADLRLVERGHHSHIASVREGAQHASSTIGEDSSSSSSSSFSDSSSSSSSSSEDSSSDDDGVMTLHTLREEDRVELIRQLSSLRLGK